MPAERPTTRVVALNTFAFVVAFAAWIMLGPSAKTIARELSIAPQTAALLKALPILTGSLLRIPLGALVDRLGARVVFPALLVAGSLGAIGASYGSTVAHFVIGGLVLGLVGTTFAVGVQSVSFWTPPARQGLAMGIFGAGNVGTAITTLSMPLLLAQIGFRGAFRVYAVALLVTACIYGLAMPSTPKSAPRPMRALLAPIGDRRAWYLGFLYMATFGVFVGTTLTLSDVYESRYGLTPKLAGVLATTFTFTASLVRIAGGALSDRFGAPRVTRAVLPAIGLFLSPVVLGPPLPVTVCLVLSAGLAMGIGMASVMKLVPTHFPSNVGVVGGIVGALGGVAGFYLPIASAWRGRGSSASLQLIPAILLSFAAALAFILRESGAPVRDVA